MILVVGRNPCHVISTSNQCIPSFQQLIFPSESSVNSSSESCIINNKNLQQHLHRQQQQQQQYTIKSVHCGPEQAWFITEDNSGTCQIFVSGSTARHLLGMTWRRSSLDGVNNNDNGGDDDDDDDDGDGNEGNDDNDTVLTYISSLHLRRVSHFDKDGDRFNDPIVKICSGYSSAFWITRRGVAFVTGDNGEGACGMGADVAICDVPMPFVLPNHELIMDVSCGFGHAMILAMDGTLWTTGRNDYGQLGLENRSVVYVPEMVKFPSGTAIQAVSAGYNHSMALAVDGTLWAFGANNLGQLGTRSFGNIHPIPKRVELELPTRFIKVWTGNNHTVMLTCDGDLYSTGCNTDGRLGLDDLTDRTVPAKISLPERPVHDVVCGSWHTLYILNGNVYSSGSNSDGQSGVTGSQTIQKILPVTLPGYFLAERNLSHKDISIACGEAFTIVYLGSETNTITRHFAKLYSTHGFKDIDIVTRIYN